MNDKKELDENEIESDDSLEDEGPDPLEQKVEALSYSLVQNRQSRIDDILRIKMASGFPDYSSMIVKSRTLSELFNPYAHASAKLETLFASQNEQYFDSFLRRNHYPGLESLSRAREVFPDFLHKRGMIDSFIRSFADLQGTYPSLDTHKKAAGRFQDIIGIRAKIKELEFSNLQLNSLYKKLEQFTQIFPDMYRNQRWKSFAFNPDGSITLNDRTVSKEEIEKYIDPRLLNPDVPETPDGIYERLDLLLAQVKQISNEKEGITHFFGKHFIYFLIFHFLMHLFQVEHNIHELLNSVLPLKETKKIVSQISPDDSNLRIVNIGNDRRTGRESFLHVREMDKKSSRSIGQLYHGEVVRVIYKHKNWSLIERPQISTGPALIGWAFTRYLDPVKSRSR